MKTSASLKLFHCLSRVSLPETFLETSTKFARSAFNKFFLEKKLIRWGTDLLSSILLIAACLVSSTLHADTIEIASHPTFKPTKATGIIFSSRGTTQRVPGTIKSDGEIYLVSFEVSAEEKRAGLSATALLANDEGATAYGDVVQLSTTTPSRSYLTLRECNPLGDPAVTTQIANADESDLGSLVAIRDFRIKKASNERALIRSAMTGTLAIKLAKLEKGLGLYIPGEEDLSSELPAAELANRLSALNAALSSYIRVQAAAKGQ